ncbi:hypothetical protein ACVWWR_008114 [Bradyrhizobium sp. LM3.2]
MPSALSGSLSASVPDPDADGVTYADQLGKAPLEFGDWLAQGEITGRHQSADLGQDRCRVGELLEQIGISNVVHGARQVE